MNAFNFSGLLRRNIREMSDRVQRTRMSTSLFRIAIDERLAAIAGPASLLLVLLYLYFRVLHLEGLGKADVALLSQYPWAQLFGGAKGVVAELVMLFALPLSALIVFGVRVWRSALVVENASWVRGWECSLVSSAAAVIAASLVLELRRIRSRYRMDDCEVPLINPNT